ncbi:unnamed protein product [Effrenium voratum]|uniref:Poly [ADP-ribose] polymerase n=1 Tax=Effrenium voratum TaxID=2562239 RepID=A0AA36J7Q6_9DINO|nr:unnamed protein product [Effrenium voratum]CAJ1435374.1 unnamed protein product [Effrenium voratum]
MLALLFFAVTRPALAWTRLTVVHSEKCEESGCQVAAKCPEKTWPVACESEPRGHAWFNQGSCTASARLDIEIRAKVACTSMFETFTVSGPTARCPAGSQLQRCFCQACLGAAQPVQDEGPACSVRAVQAEEDPARLAQALCLRGDSHWLLQNSESLGFVKYCGWVPYLRPMNTPELEYRNDTFCPRQSATSACGECLTREDCVARCDLCSNCTAVLYRPQDAVRCYMQRGIHSAAFEDQPPPASGWGFYVNERNVGCGGQVDLLAARGVQGVRLFADLGCSSELQPEKLFVMDGSGLAELKGAWLPRCAELGRCDAGGVSIIASFATPQVVRCITVQAQATVLASGWRLSKNSAALSGLRSLTEATWLEVARSGDGAGVRASWDGLMEVEADLRSSLSSWDEEHLGAPPALGGLVTVLLSIFLLAGCLLCFFCRPKRRFARESQRLPFGVAPVVLPPPEEALSLEEIQLHPAHAAKEEEAATMTYLTSEALERVQELLDFTFRTRSPEGRQDSLVALQARCAVRVQGKEKAYVQRRSKISRDLKPLPDPWIALAVAKYPALEEVLVKLQPEKNEVYLWHGTSIRKALAMCQTGPGRTQTALHFFESSAQAHEVTSPEVGHYSAVRALVLCRVCLGRFYYTTTDGSTERRDGFDSLLVDGDLREFWVYDADQVNPELLVLYSPLQREEMDRALGAFRLEMPIYWANQSLEDTFHALHVCDRRTLQRLAGRHIIAKARRLEDSALWSRYARARARSGRIPPGLLQAPELDLQQELLLWHLPDPEEAELIMAEGCFPGSPRRRRGIHLTEDLSNGQCRRGAGRFILLCRAVIGELHYAATLDLAAVQTARAAGKDALLLRGGGPNHYVFLKEDQLYPEFIIELLQDTE